MEKPTPRMILGIGTGRTKNSKRSEQGWNVFCATRQLFQEAFPGKPLYSVQLAEAPKTRGAKPRRLTPVQAHRTIRELNDLCLLMQAGVDYKEAARRLKLKKILNQCLLIRVGAA